MVFRRLKYIMVLRVGLLDTVSDVRRGPNALPVGGLSSAGLVPAGRAGWTGLLWAGLVSIGRLKTQGVGIYPVSEKVVWLSRKRGTPTRVRRLRVWVGL